MLNRVRARAPAQVATRARAPEAAAPAMRAPVDPLRAAAPRCLQGRAAKPAAAPVEEPWEAPAAARGKARPMRQCPSQMADCRMQRSPTAAHPPCAALAAECRQPIRPGNSSSTRWSWSRASRANTPCVFPPATTRTRLTGRSSRYTVAARTTTSSSTFRPRPVSMRSSSLRSRYRAAASTTSPACRRTCLSSMPWCSGPRTISASTSRGSFRLDSAVARG